MKEYKYQITHPCIDELSFLLKFDLYATKLMDIFYAKLKPDALIETEAEYKNNRREILSMNLTDIEIEDLLDAETERYRKKKEKISTVEFSIEEFSAIIGSKNVNISSLKKVCEELRKDIITLKNNEIHAVPLFKKCIFNIDTQVISMILNNEYEEVRRLFFYTPNVHYIKYLLGETIKMKSVYSYRLFVILKIAGFQSGPDTRISLNGDTLRAQLGCVKPYYQDNHRFMGKVIRPACEEITKFTGLNVKAQIVRAGRTAGSTIRFDINKKLTEIGTRVSPRAALATFTPYTEKNKNQLREYYEKSIAPELIKNLSLEMKQITDKIDLDTYCETIINDTGSLEEGMRRTDELAVYILSEYICHDILKRNPTIVEVECIKELYRTSGRKDMQRIDYAIGEAAVRGAKSINYIKTMLDGWDLQNISTKDLAEGHRPKEGDAFIDPSALFLA